MIIMKKKLLILDLDETLIHAVEMPLERPADAEIGSYYIYHRPGLDFFLDQCAYLFDLAVWTVATRDYARAVIAASFGPGRQLRFMFARERCTISHDHRSGLQVWIKDLKKVKRLGYSLDSVIAVEDKSENLCRNYGNLITVTPYTGQEDDRELYLLVDFLGYLNRFPDVRMVEKRSWRKPLSDGADPGNRSNPEKSPVKKEEHRGKL